MLFEDYAGIEDQFQEARLNPDLAYLLATDESGNIVEAFRLDIAEAASYRDGDGRVTLPNGREVYRTVATSATMRIDLKGLQKGLYLVSHAGDAERIALLR